MLCILSKYDNMHIPFKNLLARSLCNSLLPEHQIIVATEALSYVLYTLYIMEATLFLCHLGVHEVACSTFSITTEMFDWILASPWMEIQQAVGGENNTGQKE